MGLPARGARAFPGNLEEANRAGMIPKIRVRTSECSTHLYWRTFMRCSLRGQAKIEESAIQRRLKMDYRPVLRTITACMVAALGASAAPDARSVDDVLKLYLEAVG